MLQWTHTAAHTHRLFSASGDGSAKRPRCVWIAASWAHHGAWALYGTRPSWSGLSWTPGAQKKPGGRQGRQPRRIRRLRSSSPADAQLSLPEVGPCAIDHACAWQAAKALRTRARMLPLACLSSGLGAELFAVKVWLAGHYTVTGLGSERLRAGLRRCPCPLKVVASKPARDIDHLANKEEA